MIQIRNEKYHCPYNNNNDIFTSSCLIRNYNNQNIGNEIRVLAAWNNHGVWLSRPGQQNTVAQMRTQKKEREEKKRFNYVIKEIRLKYTLNLYMNIKDINKRRAHNSYN